MHVGGLNYKRLFPLPEWAAVDPPVLLSPAILGRTCNIMKAIVVVCLWHPNIQLGRQLKKSMGKLIQKESMGKKISKFFDKHFD